jgi:hypothetical protein
MALQNNFLHNAQKLVTVYKCMAQGDKEVGQGCQFPFCKCFIFLIGMKCFSFGIFWRAVSGLYCSYIYIYSTNIIQIQDKLIINYTIQTQCQINIILKFKIFLNSQD